MHAGEATILLRAEHAPPPRAPPFRAHSPPRCRTADLRRFRMARRPLDAPFTVNGHGPPGVAADTRPGPPTPGPTPAVWPASDTRPAPDVRLAPDTRPAPAEQHDARSAPNGAGLGSRLRRLLEYEPRIDESDDLKTLPPDLRPKLEDEEKCPKIEPKDETKEEASTSDESGAGALAAGSLAAAIIRRAVLLCRASLYPGLHTILAPAPPAPPAECAWCARHFAARRCLWYGAPREPPAAARAWRRARGRRYLCACCGAAEPPPDAPDEGGWYGKGYRKGRRKRR